MFVKWTKFLFEYMPIIGMENRLNVHKKEEEKIKCVCIQLALTRWNMFDIIVGQVKIENFQYDSCVCVFLFCFKLMM